MHTESVLQFNPVIAAELLSHAYILLAAFSLTIIVLITTSTMLREDPLARLMMSALLVGFVGCLLASGGMTWVAAYGHPVDHLLLLLWICVQALSSGAAGWMVAGVFGLVLRWLPDRQIEHTCRLAYVVACVVPCASLFKSSADLSVLAGGVTASGARPLLIAGAVAVATVVAYLPRLIHLSRTPLPIEPLLGGIRVQLVWFCCCLVVPAIVHFTIPPGTLLPGWLRLGWVFAFGWLFFELVSVPGLMLFRFRMLESATGLRRPARPDEHEPHVPHLY